MFKIDLYFAGSSHNQASEWITELGCNRLFSQEINRPEIKKMVELRKNNGYSGKILIDSGAFTAHRKSIKIDVDEYIDYLNSITEWVDVYAQVDTIPGEFGKPKTREQLLEAPKLSWENYLYMRDKLKEPDKLMPIYHQGESIEWLENILEAKFDGKPIQYIGISPANDKSQVEKNKFIEMCFKLIKRSSNPNVKTHAYGMTNLKTLEKYPFTSADSTSWALTAVNGSIMTPWGVIPTSAQNTNSRAFRGLPTEIQNKIRNHLSARNFNIDDMIEAPTETVIDRIKAKGVELSREELFHFLTFKPPGKKPEELTSADIKNLKLMSEIKEKLSRNKAWFEIVRFEKGRSISGNFERKAYLERIHWNIRYLKEWADNYSYQPVIFRKRSLLHD